MFCESCGSLIPDGNSFCSNCGAPVTAKPATTTPVIAQAAAPAPAPSVQPAQPVYQQPQAQPVQPVYQQPQAQPVQPVYQQPQAQPVQPIYQQPAQPVYQQPVYQQAAMPVVQPVYQRPVVSAVPAKRRNGAATAGLVLGILTLVFCAIPFVYGIFGLLSFIFSIVGIAKRNASGKGRAIAGLILCVVGIAGGIAIQNYFWSYVGTEAEKIYESVMDEYEDLSTNNYGSSNSNDNYYVDGDFVDTQNGYVTGNLHIDGYRVQF